MTPSLPITPPPARLARLGAPRAALLVAGVLAAHLGLALAATHEAVGEPVSHSPHPARLAGGEPVVLVGVVPVPGTAAETPTETPAEKPAERAAESPAPVPMRVPTAGALPGADATTSAAAEPAPPAIPADEAALRSVDPIADRSSAAGLAEAAPVDRPAEPSDNRPPEHDGSAWRVAMTPEAASPGTPLPSAQPGPAAAREVPVYPTRIPPPVVLSYDLRRGLFSGTGELSWRPQGDRYAARLEGRIAGLTVLEWSSDGHFDSAGLAPDRFVDRRRTGSRHAANFQREAGKVSYSGPSVEYPLVPGAQDRLSWMVQIAAIAQARPQAVAASATVSMWVSGARGDGAVWTFRSLGLQPLALPGGTVGAVKLQRLPRGPYDTHVEVWLEPARAYLPVRARLASGRDDDVLDLILRP